MPADPSAAATDQPAGQPSDQTSHRASGPPAQRKQDRRQRISDLVVALICQQGELELLDGGGQVPAAGADAASWLERNRRLIQRYQSLVRTAATLDALIDQEIAGDF
jgi:hypothetical protein